MSSRRITPEELDGLLVVMRRHGAHALRLPGVHVVLGPEPYGYRQPASVTASPVDGAPASPEGAPEPTTTTAGGVPLPPELQGRVDGSDPLYDSVS